MSKSKIICLECDNENDAKDNFCRNCGKKVPFDIVERFKKCERCSFDNSEMIKNALQCRDSEWADAIGSILLNQNDQNKFIEYKTLMEAIIFKLKGSKS